MVQIFYGNLGFLSSLLTTIISLNTFWTSPVIAGILAEILVLHHNRPTCTTLLQAILKTMGSDPVNSLGWALKKTKHCYVKLHLGQSVKDSTVPHLSSCILHVGKAKIGGLYEKVTFAKHRLRPKASKENSNTPPCEQNMWTSWLGH